MPPVPSRVSSTRAGRNGANRPSRVSDGSGVVAGGVEEVGDGDGGRGVRLGLSEPGDGEAEPAEESGVGEALGAGPASAPLGRSGDGEGDGDGLPAAGLGLCGADGVGDGRAPTRPLEPAGPIAVPLSARTSTAWPPSSSCTVMLRSVVTTVRPEPVVTR